MPNRDLYAEMQRVRYIERENGGTVDFSNFVDLDWISSGNSCEEELFERWLLRMVTAKKFIQTFRMGIIFVVSDPGFYPWMKSIVTVSQSLTLSEEIFVNELNEETTPSTSECGSSTRGREATGTDLGHGEFHNYEVLEDFSDSFVRWVTYGETICH
ncbi:hypothetical protein OROMI_012590 [Orobanche minor]